MIELVVAVSVFAILAGGLALTIDGGLNLARNNRNRSIAANLASQEMDEVRQEPFISLPLGLVDRTEPSSTACAYTVRREIEWVDNDSTTGPCDASARHSAGPAGLGQRLLARHAGRRTREVVDDPQPAGRLVRPEQRPHRGEGARQRRGAARRGPGRASPRPRSPGTSRRPSDGCAFFAFVPPATYTVRLDASGYVDRQGVASPAQLTGVTSGETSSIAFDYDQRRDAHADPQLARGRLVPVEPRGRCRQHRADAVRLGRSSRAPAPFAPIGNLFPYSDGYAALGGHLRRRRPAGRRRQRPRVLARCQP